MPHRSSRKLRLTRFKSFRDARLPLRVTTRLEDVAHRAGPGDGAVAGGLVADDLPHRFALLGALDGEEAGDPQRRPSGSPEPWTFFAEVLSDWEDRHRNGVQKPTMATMAPCSKTCARSWMAWRSAR